MPARRPTVFIGTVLSLSMERREHAMRRVLVFASLSVLLPFASPSFAQTSCVTCGLDGHCTYVASGFGACTDYPTDPTCKLACPDCPNAPCDRSGGGGGGGGGGNCLVFDPIGTFDRVEPTKTVVTAGLLFRTDAATNAHVFGGRGQGYLLVPGAGFGDLTADGAARAIQSLSPIAMNELVLAHAFTNVNNAGIPISFVSPDGEGFGFAPGSSGSSARLQLRTRGMTHIARALGSVDLSGGELLLVDVSIHGQAYILVLETDVLDRSLGSETRLRAIQDSMRRGYQLYPYKQDPPIHEC
jgi:hypothetical protein